LLPPPGPNISSLNTSATFLRRQFFDFVFPIIFLAHLSDIWKEQIRRPPGRRSWCKFSLNIYENQLFRIHLEEKYYFKVHLGCKILVNSFMHDFKWIFMSYCTRFEYCIIIVHRNRYANNHVYLCCCDIDCVLNNKYLEYVQYVISNQTLTHFIYECTRIFIHAICKLPWLYRVIYFMHSSQSTFEGERESK
jgi:hypothetical protein